MAPTAAPSVMRLGSIVRRRSQMHRSRRQPRKPETGADRALPQGVKLRARLVLVPRTDARERSDPGLDLDRLSQGGGRLAQLACKAERRRKDQMNIIQP